MMMFAYAVLQGERAASELLAAESAKLNGMMRGPDANLAAVEGELRR